MKEDHCIGLHDFMFRVNNYYEVFELGAIEMSENNISKIMLNDEQKSKLVKFYFTLIINALSLNINNGKVKDISEPLTDTYFMKLITECIDFAPFSFISIHKTLMKMFQGNIKFKAIKVNYLAIEYLRAIEKIPNIKLYSRLIDEIKFDSFCFYLHIVDSLPSYGSNIFLKSTIKCDTITTYRKILIYLLSNVNTLSFLSSFENFHKVFSFLKIENFRQEEIEFIQFLKGIITYSLNPDYLITIVESIRKKLILNIENKNYTYLNTLYLGIIQNYSHTIIMFDDIELTFNNIGGINKILLFIIFKVNEYSQSDELNINAYIDKLCEYLGSSWNLLEVEINTTDKKLIRNHYLVFNVLIDCLIALMRRDNFDRTVKYCINCCYRINNATNTKLLIVCPKCDVEHLCIKAIYDERYDNYSKTLNKIFLIIFKLIQEKFEMNKKRYMKLLYFLMKNVTIMDSGLIDELQIFFSDWKVFEGMKIKLRRIRKMKLLINSFKKTD
jgi:hypothetical protein